MIRVMQIIMLYLIMETVDTNEFSDPSGIISFSSRVRTQRLLKLMHLTGTAGSKGLAPLSCVRTQL